MISDISNEYVPFETKEEETVIPASPIAPMGVIAADSAKDLAEKVNYYIAAWRNEDKKYNTHHVDMPGHTRDTYLIQASCPRFQNGEGKSIIEESVRGYDLFILSDIGNYGCKYELYGADTRMSPDDHFQDLKRIISTACGKARRVNVIMPLLYGSRQHKRVARESLDCALGLQELNNLGVENIVVFDAHDPSVQNAIPLTGFENVLPTYQMIKALLRDDDSLQIDKDHMMVISPDNGAMTRAIYYANVLGLNVGMFYKRRDLTRLVNGRNPIVAHEYLGDSVEGKDLIIIDDMLATGDSMLDVARELKRRKANKIYIAVTYGLFSLGVERFHKAYEEGIFTKILSTNLTYRPPELQAASWYVEVNMAKYIAYIIEALNHDQSISKLLNPMQKINDLLEQYRNKR